MLPPERQFLLSLPPAMAAAFASLDRYPFPGWFASSDPPGGKLGSGGGLIHLLHEDWKALGKPERFSRWILSYPKLAILAGGQSRRLPAYAATGKVLIPLPILRSGTGQRIDGTLLDFMLPEFSRILDAAAGDYPLMVCSGDVLLRFPREIPPLPRADLLGLGMWVPPETASSFGVFFSRRESPHQVAFFRQKPSPQEIAALGTDHLPIVDAGVWLLGPKAIECLLAKCGWNEEENSFRGEGPSSYEMYGDFGPALGRHPTSGDPAISALSAAVLPVSGAGFYHVGTSRQLIESVSALQSNESNPLSAAPAPRKPNPDIYTQNSDFAFSTRHAGNRLLWIENSALSPDEPFSSRQVVTGVPEEFPALDLPEGICLDVIPVGETAFCLRPYGFEDKFSGAIDRADCLWLGRPASQWFDRRGIGLDEAGLAPGTDIQMAPIFPVVERDEVSAGFLHWLYAENAVPDEKFRALFLHRRLSAMEICEQCNIARLLASRSAHLARALPVMRANHLSNPFFRIDLSSAAPLFPPDRLTTLVDTAGFDAISDAMLRATVLRARGLPRADEEEAKAFRILRESILASIRHLLKTPRKTTLEDQIVWGRSPVRLDLAGGWTDTPPYCFKEGGSVVNVAADINGQPPIQVFVRVAREPVIVLRSIDLGVEERVTRYEDLVAYDRAGDAFALTRAALCLAGFHPDFQEGASPHSLREMLETFGGGLEVSLLAAVPKGSGLGTSSILASTLLGTLSDACGLGWDRNSLVPLTVALEQMLTTCGGWQDQAGGIHRGIKHIQTQPGLDQNISLRWLPENDLADAAKSGRALLYYTGLTRMASGTLKEIVRGMFLNSSRHLHILSDIRANASTTFEAMLQGNWDELAGCVDRSWRLNCRLDSGTDPDAVRRIFACAGDFILGGKLLGAGGGGYALFLAKDEDAGRRLRRALEENCPNRGARFVDFSLSPTGLQISRS